MRLTSDTGFHPQLCDNTTFFTGIRETFSQAFSPQPLRFEFRFVQAKVMAEFVDVGDAHLFVKGRQVFSAVIPELGEEERDGRRLKAIGIGRFVEGGPAEEPHRVIRHALLKPMLGHLPFAINWSLLGQRPQVRRQFRDHPPKNLAHTALKLFTNGHGKQVRIKPAEPHSTGQDSISLSFAPAASPVQ